MNCLGWDALRLRVLHLDGDAVRDAGPAMKHAKNWPEHLEHSVPYEREAKE
jgi:hypothetical protein